MGLSTTIERDSLFTDRTNDWKYFQKALKRLLLAEIRNTFDELLMPDVL